MYVYVYNVLLLIDLSIILPYICMYMYVCRLHYYISIFIVYYLFEHDITVLHASCGSSFSNKQTITLRIRIITIFFVVVCMYLYVNVYCCFDLC